MSEKEISAEAIKGTLKVERLKTPRDQLRRKLFQLQTVMGEYAWEKDGINRHQSYKYITEKQYKTNFKRALKEVGLTWSMNTEHVEFIPAITEKQHLVICDFTGILTDPDTGETELYYFKGSGSDTGDKALYKAITGGLKYFLASNFNVSEDSDPEADEEKPEPKRPATPVAREAIKEELVGKNDQANEMMVNTLKGSLKELGQLNPDEKDFIQGVASKTKNFTDLSKKACEALILEVNYRIEKAKE